MFEYSDAALTKAQIRQSHHEMLKLLDEVDQFLKSRNAGLCGNITLEPPSAYDFHISAKVSISLQIKAFP